MKSLSLPLASIAVHNLAVMQLLQLESLSKIAKAIRFATGYPRTAIPDIEAGVGTKKIYGAAVPVSTSCLWKVHDANDG
jgi:hypothetical protein